MDDSYDFKKFAILYVDDEEMSLKYFTRAFGEHFRILTAANARDLPRRELPVPAHEHLDVLVEPLAPEGLLHALDQPRAQQPLGVRQRDLKGGERGEKAEGKRFGR